VVASADEPLPEFVVTPEATVDLHAPPPIPAPEPEPELGPLPDYVVDPDRPPDLKPPPPPERPVTPPPAPFVEIPAKTVAEEPVSGLNFPSVVSFPVPRAGTDDDDEHDAPRAPRPRPTADQGKGKRGKSGGAEPGDEAEEVSWMQGLSNRLSAYSLSEEDASPSDDPAADTPEDAETGT
jgi:hypothetical protein